MEYIHQFAVRAPLSQVRAFHQRADGLALLTPPPVRVEFVDAPPSPQAGDRLAFTLWLGPLAIPWVAAFSNVDENGFTDTQVSGPFRRWVHEHRFRPLGDGTTEIRDRITAEVGFSRWTPVAAAIWLGLPRLFRHRVRMTRQALAANGV